MKYRTCGLASLYDLFGDYIIYRNLVPQDARLPSLDQLRGPLGLEKHAWPRKAELAYGRAVAALLRIARELDLPGQTIKRLIYVGDTQLNDGTAFANICAAGGWDGRAFIGRDDPDHPCQVEMHDGLCLANRWSALPSFVQNISAQGFGLDEETALVIDIDKTSIGARGRNDGVIDRARLEGVERTVSELVGSGFDKQSFQVAYQTLNQPRYHAFSSDNQDYLAYTCLMVSSGMFDFETLVHEIDTGSLRRFGDLIVTVEGRRDELAATGLTPVHDAVWNAVQTGDPTPFKAFRYNEYLATAARFVSTMDRNAEETLSQRIVITQEVRQVAAWVRERGVLILAISDKPDEASLPSKEQRAVGMKPLHHLTTLAVGESVL